MMIQIWMMLVLGAVSGFPSKNEAVNLPMRAAVRTHNPCNAGVHQKENPLKGGSVVVMRNTLA